MKMKCNQYDKTICGKCSCWHYMEHNKNQYCDDIRTCKDRKIAVTCSIDGAKGLFKKEIERILEI